MLIPVLSALAFAVPSAELPAARSVSVTGDAEIKVPPDQVILTLAVETVDKDLMTAKQSNDERAKRVLAVTQQFHIEPKHVQTDQVTIEPRYHDSDRRDFLGFFVRKELVICLKDVGRFEDLLTALLKAGTNYVQGVQFQNTQLRRFRDQARQMAVRAAKEKATALAAELGQKLGHPLSINENINTWSPYASNRGYLAAQNVASNAGGGEPDSSETGFAPGQISVNANVAVSFALAD
jgi:uncharacterized protein YggE